jgi:adenylate cyclase
VKIQREFAELNVDVPFKRKMKFRIGVNVGDVVEEENRIYGEGVNIAARVESMANAGGISISGRAYDQVANKIELEYENIGEHKVKNISTPIRIYRVITETNLSEGSGSEEHDVLPFPDKPSIAVLPFNNMSGDSEQEYFSDGITEDIITALSRSPWLFVIARNSSFTYRGEMVDVKQISRELGVRYILEGSVRKAGNRVRVTAQLIDGTIGNHVWAEKYDGELKEIFELQDQFTQQVVAALITQIQMNVGIHAKPLERHDIGTWDLLARCYKFHYEFTNDSLAAAETLSRRAVASAPTSCDANWLLASVLIHQFIMGYDSDKDETISEAYEKAKQAVSLDENHEYAHLTLGIVHFHRGKPNLAIAELKRSIELNPNCSLAYGILGEFLSKIDPDESIKNNKIAIRTNPRDPSNFFRYAGLARAHFTAGRYLEASQWARKSVQRKPSWRDGHVYLAASLAQSNLFEEAKEAVNNYLEYFPDETISKIRKFWTTDRPEVEDRIEEGLRKAGLLE